MDGLLILLPGLLLLFDHSLDAGVPELGHEAVDAGFGVDGEAVFHFKELVGGVEVGLGESDVGDGVDNLEVIV